MKLRWGLLVLVLLTACSAGVSRSTITELSEDSGLMNEESSTESVGLPTPTSLSKNKQGQDKQNSKKETKTQQVESADVSWNPAPDHVVISVSNFGGLIPEMFVKNYIPEMQIYGDGRVIWVNTKPNGSRAVLVGQLSAGEMTDLLQRIEASGFYSWEDRYANPLIMDAPEKCIRVKTLEQEKGVCEYIEGAPEAFGLLFEWLAKGAGVVGQPFVPERGYVTSYPVGTTRDQVSGMVFEWEAGDGIVLAELQKGDWLEGKALRVAWQMANASPGMSLIREGDTYYQISVQLPGVSLQSPSDN